MNNEPKKTIKLILTGVGLAMGIAVFVLSVTGNIDGNTSARLLSVGVIAYGINSLRVDND